MKNTRYRVIFSIGALIAAFAVISSAQVLRNQNRYSKRDVSNIISKLDRSSSQFRRDFDREMDRSPINGTREEDRYNDIVKAYDRAASDFKRDFNRTNEWWTVRNQLSSLINQAQQVNDMMNSLPFGRKLDRQWNAMRNDINTLADTYDLPGLAGGGWWCGGNWGAGGNMTPPPSWAVGTFYSTDGSNITLTFNSNGSASAMVGGQMFSGTYFRGNLYLNGDTSTVDKWGNDGIRTYNRNKGTETYYTRSRWNSGGNWNGNGNMSRPPMWAIGTFYSTDGSNITLTFDKNGRATAVNNGQTFYGTYYNGSLYLNNDTSTVEQWGNDGIRTYNRNTRRYTNYTRSGAGGNWGNTSRPPTWAIGTFYGNSAGTNITLTINQDGSVAAFVNGQAFYGTYYQNTITLNGDTSNVTRSASGITTYNRNTGQTTVYMR